MLGTKLHLAADRDRPLKYALCHVEHLEPPGSMVVPGVEQFI